MNKTSHTSRSPVQRTRPMPETLFTIYRRTPIGSVQDADIGQLPITAGLAVIGDYLESTAFKNDGNGAVVMDTLEFVHVGHRFSVRVDPITATEDTEDTEASDRSSWGAPEA